MIRSRVHGRFIRGATEGELLWRTISRHKKTWTWRYFEWHVDRYGDQIGSEPAWERPIGRFVGWVSDWETTWRLRPWGMKSA